MAVTRDIADTSRRRCMVGTSPLDNIFDMKVMSPRVCMVCTPPRDNLKGLWPLYGMYGSYITCMAVTRDIADTSIRGNLGSWGV